MANVRPTPLLLSLRSPTAQISVGEEALTPLRMLLPELGFGLDTCFQAVPFQCRISVLCANAPPVTYPPTAQTSVRDTAATPRRMLFLDFPTGLGLGSCLHAEPFQC